jgi:hypothetical protein
MTFGLAPRSSVMARESGIVPPRPDSPEEAAALLALLTRHAAQIDYIELDLSGGALRSSDELEVYLVSEAAPGRLLDPATPFAPALRALRIYAPNLTPNLLSIVPTFYDYLEVIYMEADDRKDRLNLGPLRLHAGLFAGLRRLRSLSFYGVHHGPFVLNANLLGLSSLTALDYLVTHYGTLTEDDSVLLEDPEGWLDPTRHAAASPLPNLERGRLDLPPLSDTSFVRLIPALQHVTKLELNIGSALGTLQTHMGTFTRLRDVKLAFDFWSEEAMTDLPTIFTLPLPATVESLFISTYTNPVAATVPAAFFARLPALASLELRMNECYVTFEPVTDDLPALRAFNLWVASNVMPASVAHLLRRCPALDNLRLSHIGRRHAADGRADVVSLLERLNI